MGEAFPRDQAASPGSVDGLARTPQQRVLKGHRGPKSKNGCTNCKARRIKCDEGKPNCQNCVTKILECAYAPRKPSVSRPGGRRGSITKTSPETSKSATPEAMMSSLVDYPRSDNLGVINTRCSVSQPSARQTSQANEVLDHRFGHLGPLASSSEASPIDFGSLSSVQDQHVVDAINSFDSTSAGLEKGAITQEEMLLTKVFFQTSTHLFSIYTGPCNPFMRLRQYLPHSKALRLAVQAMAALTISDYQSADQARHMDRGLELQRLAYRELSLVLTDPVASLSDATFAAIVHIGMTEPWHSLRSDQSGAMHLRTSKVLICQRQQARRPLPPKYLCNLLLYWDLLVSLHSDSSHEGYSTEMLLSGLHSEDEPIDYIDPTLGVAVQLCSIIIDLENFLRFRRLQPKDVENAHHLEVAMALERRLSSWQPELDITKLSGCLGVFQTSSLQDILFTAEAYRQTALLLLYRSVPKIIPYIINPDPVIPTHLFLGNLASSIMRLLAAIGLSSPVCTTHEWVLFVAAPDVANAAERQFVRERMSGLLEKIGIVGIKEVMNYIEEIWTLIDSGQEDSSMWMDGMHRRSWYPLLG